MSLAIRRDFAIKAILQLYHPRLKEKFRSQEPELNSELSFTFRIYAKLQAVGAIDELPLTENLSFRLKFCVSPNYR